MRGFFIYTSDHGDMNGNKGYYGKQVFYDDSVHIPFLIQETASAGNTDRQPDESAGSGTDGMRAGRCAGIKRRWKEPGVSAYIWKTG